MHVVPTKVNQQMSKPLEEEEARQFCSISLEVYNNMVGTRRYAHLSPYQFGILVCKADVIAVYRLLAQKNSVSNYLSSK